MNAGFKTIHKIIYKKKLNKFNIRERGGTLCKRTSETVTEKLQKV